MFFFLYSLHNDIDSPLVDFNKNKHINKQAYK